MVPLTPSQRALLKTIVQQDPDAARSIMAALAIPGPGDEKTTSSRCAHCGASLIAEKENPTPRLPMLSPLFGSSWTPLDLLLLFSCLLVAVCTVTGLLALTSYVTNGSRWP